MDALISLLCQRKTNLKNVNFDHNHAGEEAIDLAIDESIRVYS
jgi:hypothetical protein